MVVDAHYDENGMLIHMELVFSTPKSDSNRQLATPPATQPRTTQSAQFEATSSLPLALLGGGKQPTLDCDDKEEGFSTADPLPPYCEHGDFGPVSSYARCEICGLKVSALAMEALKKFPSIMERLERSDVNYDTLAQRFILTQLRIRFLHIQRTLASWLLEDSEHDMIYQSAVLCQAIPNQLRREQWEEAYKKKAKISKYTPIFILDSRFALLSAYGVNFETIQKDMIQMEKESVQYEQEKAMSTSRQTGSRASGGRPTSA
ncbi:hypothetical protein FA15DRAFT_710823 [Coprinopsis marcescibilis]|uniref:Uncharacterized protein n=1 Tax=Coprinopsis marcescibilis TaxID=230819 RepID=A0A5C3KC35_COPMA|nr:hypothetical protein FA15DRAFT_710823 [Coprinopsis marcescibilis]